MTNYVNHLQQEPNDRKINKNLKIYQDKKQEGGSGVATCCTSGLWDIEMFNLDILSSNNVWIKLINYTEITFELNS